MNGMDANVAEADAESLPFAEGEFDIVYSWGVIHHSPDTPAAVAEIRRVLRKGGRAKVMIYHSRSIVGFLLWLRYALLRGRPWLSRRRIYAQYLESPGTKAYSVREARRLFGDFASVTTHIELSAGDLLEGEAGQRHKGRALSIARWFWPRRLLRRVCRNHGLFLMIQAVK
jgi:SAM-dependent methyltransferase